MGGCLTIFKSRIAPIDDISMCNIDDIITNYDVRLAEEAWNHIINSTSPVFIAASVMGIVSTDSLSWFFDTFYGLVKKQNTNVYNVFHDNLKIKAHALMGIVTNSLKIAKRLSEKRDDIDFKKIHDFHARMNIKYEYYIVISNVLLKTFKHCLGGLWKHNVKMAWQKILDYIVKRIYYCENMSSKVNIFINNVLQTPILSHTSSNNDIETHEQKEKSFFQIFKNRLSERHKINVISEIDEELSY